MAGYRVLIKTSAAKELEAVGAKADRQRIIGLEKLKIIHLNDSKKDFGSRVDRHERIGKGKIGLEGFRVLLNDRDLRNIPMILEIAGGNDVYREDILLLRSLKK